MKTARLITLLLAGVFCVAGCTSSEQALVRDKAAFESLRPGQSRLGVQTQVGRPTDRADSFYHYEAGAARDAWVYFDRHGRVSQVEWQDEHALRLDWTAQYLGK